MSYNRIKTFVQMLKSGGRIYNGGMIPSIVTRSDQTAVRYKFLKQELINN